MQPTLIVATETPGLLYLNGRFAGEIDAGREAAVPCPAFGAVYMEYHPLTDSHLPFAARLTMSGGGVVEGSILPVGRAAAAIWPGNVVEVELLPAEYPARGQAETVSGDGITVAIENGRAHVAGQAYALPEGASAPQVRKSGDTVRLMGECASGRYILIVQEGGGLLLIGEGREITDSGEVIHLLTDEEDTVGHAYLQTWTRGENGYTLSSREPMWIHGAPQWPKTPEETALAALEAVRLGLSDEAAGYFLPGTDSSAVLEKARRADGCTRLKYALPDGRQAVGLVKAVSENLVRVRPVYYRAVVSGGAQGMWRLEWMQMEEG